MTILSHSPDTSKPPRRDGRTQRERDAAAEIYNPAENDYDLSVDPRCLWGWGDCGCRFGHACFRAFGHPGKCRDDSGILGRCDRRQRPKDWDAHGRAEANR